MVLKQGNIGIMCLMSYCAGPRQYGNGPRELMCQTKFQAQWESPYEIIL